MNAQSSDSLHYLNFDFGIGYGIHFSDLDYEGLIKEQGIGSFNVMWEPEHLLRVGIESGYLQLYSLDSKVYDTIFGSSDVFLTLHGVPIILLSATEILPKFEVIAGIGGIILISEVESFGNNVRSVSWSSAYEFGVSYLTPVAKKLKMGGELKSFYISSTDNFQVSLQLKFKFDFYSY